ncbi:AAA family ATPase [Candidatus Phytoplasma sacchari]|uniref:ATP-binding protein n=1 Tax=Candidatus Phytoplasma sacchari TaxID=2609813 RepID=A0ABY7M188_9MOLU|nr:ATP-binding protein [Candidatus Phytoplasma sacchari]
MKKKDMKKKDMKLFKNINIYLSILIFLLIFLLSYLLFKYQKCFILNKILKEKLNYIFENQYDDEIVKNDYNKKNESKIDEKENDLFLEEKIKKRNNHSLTMIEEDEKIFYPVNSIKFLKFDELVGFQEEKKFLEHFVDYILNKDKEKYKNIGLIEPPLGVLLYGISGTGKTTLARALARETNLPFFEVSSSLFSQKYKGIAPQMIKDLFQKAREEAIKNNGSIIFLDECETIFINLENLQLGSETANVVNQFKTEITSICNDPLKPVFIIGATNHINQIDESIKSRFTYHLEVNPGSKQEREKFLNFLIEKRQNPYSSEAKKYLLEVINEFLEQLPPEKYFLKANRTLENILKTTVFVFVNNREDLKNKIFRKEINKEDLQKAFQVVINLSNLDCLDKIENSLNSNSKK